MVDDKKLEAMQKKAMAAEAAANVKVDAKAEAKAKLMADRAKAPPVRVPLLALLALDRSDWRPLLS